MTAARRTHPGTLVRMPTGLLTLAATLPPHHVPANALRAAATTAIANADTAELARLAARLDLPGDVDDALASRRSAPVAAAIAARPNATNAAGDDVLGGETRASVLVAMLSTTSDQRIRAQIARRFLTKPTRALALAWLDQPADQVPIEVVQPVVDTLDVGLSTARASTRDHWVASLPYGTYPLPNHFYTHGRHAVYAQLSAAGPDPSNGADLARLVTDGVTGLRERATRQWSLSRLDTAALVTLVVAYTRTGRPAPEAAVEALRSIADGPDATRNRAVIPNELRDEISKWLNSNGRPRPGTMVGREIRHLPTPMSFTCLADMDNAPTHTPDGMDLAALLTWAHGTTDDDQLRTLATWVRADCDTTAAAPGQTPAASQTGVNRRAETRYALLTNPALPHDARTQLLSDLERDPVVTLTNPNELAADALLTQVTGKTRVALWAAGATQHAGRLTVGTFTADEQRDLVTAVAAATTERDLTNPGTGLLPTEPFDSRGSKPCDALRRLVRDPALSTTTFRDLPWTHMAALIDVPDKTRCPHDQPHVDQSQPAATTSTALGTWLLAEATQIVGDHTGGWRLAERHLDLTPGRYGGLTVGEVLDALAIALEHMPAEQP